MPSSTSSESFGSTSETPGVRDQGLLEHLNHAGRRDPELRKLLARIYEARVEAGRVVDGSELPESAVRRFRDLASTKIAGISLDGALELVEEWDRWLIENADATYVFSALEAEYLRAAKDEHGTSVTWNAVYPKEPMLPASLKFRSGVRMGAEGMAAARNRLAGLYRARATAYGLERARTRVRNCNLKILTRVMVIVSAVMVVALLVAYPGRAATEIFIAPAAGALGAALAGARQLQKSLPRINAERFFGTLLLSQTSVGAAVGLGLLLLLDSGWVPIEVIVSPLATSGATAFLGGFAEPFFLKIVERLTQSRAG